MLTCVTIFKTFQFICFQTRYKYTSQFRDSISNYVTSFVRLEIRDGSEKFGWIRVRFSMYPEFFRSFPKSFPRLTKSYISVFSHMVFRDKSVNLFTSSTRYEFVFTCGYETKRIARHWAPCAAANWTRAQVEKRVPGPRLVKRIWRAESLQASAIFSPFLSIDRVICKSAK